MKKLDKKRKKKRRINMYTPTGILMLNSKVLNDLYE